MKKLLLTAVLATSCLLAKSQNLDEYKASNGITYRKGDTVRLGVGSGVNQRFIYMQLGGLSSEPYDYYVKYLNSYGIVKKVKMGGISGMKKPMLYVKVGHNTYNIYLEDAIAACEVKPCAK
jgi:hypothetical protein